MEKKFYVYILASQRKGTLYVGVTSDLARRLEEHRTGAVPGFTSQYGVKTLVHYEVYNDAENAILREKRLKKWNRDWKIRLIEEGNPDWSDLHTTLNC
ncbi:MAG TPA: GIY-YIG nuclease family protein [Azospirillum sp.]|nr:GIY-YIG nuclease family protein [Azospirillum sp.]